MTLSSHKQPLNGPAYQVVMMPFPSTCIHTILIYDGCSQLLIFVSTIAIVSATQMYSVQAL